jgi:hypothetical protein
MEDGDYFGSDGHPFSLAAPASHPGDREIAS